MESQQAQRKNEHLSLAEKDYSLNHQHDFFDDLQLIPNALPEMAVKDACCNVNVAGLHLSSPFYIEAMTGGSQRTGIINQQLGKIAADCNLAIATGSMSIIFKEKTAVDSFLALRKANPDGIVIANLGAKATPKQAQAAVDLINADALEIHINAAQELVMPEGARDFHWLNNIRNIVNHLDVPVIVKEVGFGMSQQTIQQLIAIGVQWINISGRGGTNFARIENHRNHDVDMSDLEKWGLTTPESLLEAQKTPAKIIASGGIASPLDVVKAGVLGAKAVGIAGYFLHQLISSGPAQLTKVIHQWQIELPRLLTLLGCQNFGELVNTQYVLHNQLLEFQQQRQ